MKIPNEKELCWIAPNHPCDTEFKDFMKIYKNYTKEPFLFLVNGTALLSDNPVRFRKNLIQNEC